MFKQIIVWLRLNLLARKSPAATLLLLLSCSPQFAHSTRAQALSYRPTPVQTLGLHPSRPKIAAQSPAVTALVPDQEDVGRVLNNLAVAYSTLGKYDKAEAAILRAIAISEKTIGPDNVRLADQLESLADIYVIKEDRKSTRLNSSHDQISYAVFCLKKKKKHKYNKNKREV